MSTPFIGEIKMFGGNFAPRGYAFCNGQSMVLQQNTALFAILATYYGGDGRTNFNLPNLQGRAAIGMGQGPGLTQRILGATGGVPDVTLSLAEMAAHSHTANASGGLGDSPGPANTIWSAAGVSRTPDTIYASSANTSMSPNSTSQTGGGGAHLNMPPYLAVSFIIALVGDFPQRS